MFMKTGKTHGLAWSWPGFISLLLALGVSITLCATFIIISLEPHPISQQFAGVLSALSGATVGAVATFIGSSIHSRQEHQEADLRKEPQDAASSPEVVRRTEFTGKIEH